MWEDRGAKWGAQGFLFSEFGLDAREGRQVCRNQFFPDITGYYWTPVGESGRTIRYFFGSISASPLLPTGGRLVRIPAGSNEPAGSRVAGKVGGLGSGRSGGSRVAGKVGRPGGVRRETCGRGVDGVENQSTPPGPPRRRRCFGGSGGAGQRPRRMMASWISIYVCTLPRSCCRVPSMLFRWA